MKKNKSQTQIIKDKLLKTGLVSRGWCLKRYISRLSALIGFLKNDGWVFETTKRKLKKPNGEPGYDFVYKVKRKGR